MMRRILLVLPAAALMAAMVVASAVPAFADAGGQRGHLTTFGSGGCDFTVQTCTSGFTRSGGSGGPGGGHGGRTTFTSTEGPGVDTLTQSSQGGFGRQSGLPHGGGGNCTATFDFTAGTGSVSGPGNRC